MEVSYKPSFIRHLKKLPAALQEEVFEKIDAFKKIENHTFLKVHKLSGQLSSLYSFSVNYRYRILFVWETKGTSAVLVAIGDHSISG